MKKKLRDLMLSLCLTFGMTSTALSANWTVVFDNQSLATFTLDKVTTVNWDNPPPSQQWSIGPRAQTTVFSTIDSDFGGHSNPASLTAVFVDGNQQKTSVEIYIDNNTPNSSAYLSGSSNPIVGYKNSVYIQCQIVIQATEGAFPSQYNISATATCS